jgi:hypothetical protein
MKLQCNYFGIVPSLIKFLCDGLIKDTHQNQEKKKELWGTHN